MKVIRKYLQKEKKKKKRKLASSKVQCDPGTIVDIFMYFIPFYPNHSPRSKVVS